MCTDVGRVSSVIVFLYCFFYVFVCVFYIMIFTLCTSFVGGSGRGIPVAAAVFVRLLLQWNCSASSRKILWGKLYISRGYNAALT